MHHYLPQPCFLVASQLTSSWNHGFWRVISPHLRPMSVMRPLFLLFGLPFSVKAFKPQHGLFRPSNTTLKGKMADFDTNTTLKKEKSHNKKVPQGPKGPFSHLYRVGFIALCSLQESLMHQTSAHRNKQMSCKAKSE